MNVFKIALLQIAPTLSVAGNVAKGVASCQKAKALGADLAVFPELWHIGYDVSKMRPSYAVTNTNAFINTFRQWAVNLNMAIAITYLGKGSSKPTNCFAVIDHCGHLIIDYAKVHICDFAEGTEQSLEAGLAFQTATLTYKSGAVKLGGQICFDREFPESARTLMLKGAEIIITPNACPLKTCPVLGDVRLITSRTRAFENAVGMVTVNYPAPNYDGHSCAFNADGQTIVMLDSQEAITIAEFDIDFIRHWQAQEVWGYKHRKAVCYER